MTTANLIQQLVADARPVQRLPGIGRRYLLWVSFTLFCVAAGAILSGPRADLVEKAHDVSFLLESSLLLFSFGLAARSAFRLSVPGDEHPVLTLSLPLLAFVLWFSIILSRCFSGWSAGTLEMEAKPGLFCIARILGLGALPVSICFISLRRAAPLDTAWTGFFMSMSAFAIAALGTQTLCVIDRPYHLLIWHLVPVLAIGLLGAVVGRLALRR